MIQIPVRVRLSASVLGISIAVAACGGGTTNTTSAPRQAAQTLRTVFPNDVDNYQYAINGPSYVSPPGGIPAYTPTVTCVKAGGKDKFSCRATVSYELGPEWGGGMYYEYLLQLDPGSGCIDGTLTGAGLSEAVPGQSDSPSPSTAPVLQATLQTPTGEQANPLYRLSNQCG
jgi:hypothetical protein